MIISIGISSVSMIVRAALLQQMIEFPLVKYIILVLKLVLVSIVMFVGIKLSFYNRLQSLLAFIITGFALFLVLTLLYGCILEKGDRKFIVQFIKQKIRR